MPIAEETLRVGRPQSSIKGEIRESIYGTWKEEWTEARIANHTKGFYEGPNPNKARFVYKLARLELGRLARIVTGHNNLGFFQTKIGLHSNPLCRFCEQGYETINHMLTQCPRFVASRLEILNGDVPTSDMKWSVRKLLNFSYIPGLNRAFEGVGGGTWDEADLETTLDLDWLDSAGGDRGDEEADNVDAEYGTPGQELTEPASGQEHGTSDDDPRVK